MAELLTREEYPPYRGATLDLGAVAETLGLDRSLLQAQKAHLTPVFDAIARAAAEGRLRAGLEAGGRRATSVAISKAGDVAAKAVPTSNAKVPGHTGKRPGREARLIVEFPEPLFSTWDEPDSFGAVLKLHVSRHGETTYHLYDAVVRPEDGVHRSTLISWGRGTKLPRATLSLEILGRIER